MCAAPAENQPEGSEYFEPAALLSELAEGTIVQRVLASGEAVCLVNHLGTISALSDICTHQHFPMSQGDLLHDGTIQCAWHGARYDCRTGEVKQVPATSPLPVFEVKLQGNTILVGPRRRREGPRYEPSMVSAGVES